MRIFKTILIAIAASVFFMCGKSAASEINVVPLPVKVQMGEGAFIINGNTAIVAGEQGLEIAKYLAQLVAPATGFDLKVEEYADKAADTNRIVFTINPEEEGPGEEGYVLTVNKNEISISAAAPAGAFYAVQTLRQLLPPEIDSTENVDGMEWKVPAVKIMDKPRFQWRGLMLDVSRHFQPKEFVIKYIDTMAMFKLNTLHMHLTDDQGWRLEIKKFPTLTEIGAWRKKSTVADEMSMNPTGPAHGGFYTQDDIREIVAHAQKRFVTIVPEIEMPGHAQAAIASLPGLSCTKERLPVRTRWGVNKEVYCAGSEKVFNFLEGVIDEVVELFPGEYIHIGGDEVPKDRWEECPQCQARIKEEGLKNEHELQSYFIQRMEKYVNSKGKKIIGWDEILEGGLAPNAAVMSWRGTMGGMEAARKKHNVVMSPTTNCYLDYYQTDDRENEPRAIGGFVPMCRVYSFDPIPQGMGSSAGKYVLGAQGNVWSEYITESSHMEYMTYPRAAAIAELTWTPEKLKDWNDFSGRIAVVLPHLDYLGVNYRIIKPGDENLCE